MNNENLEGLEEKMKINYFYMNQNEGNAEMDNTNHNK